METYSDLKSKHQQRFDNFQFIFFAFNEEQFKEGLKRIRDLANDYESKFVSIGAGGFVLKSKIEEFENILNQNEKERKAFKKDEKKLIDAIAYELQNHEYCITGDVTDALSSLDLKLEDVPKDVLKKAIKKAQSNFVF